MEHWKLVKSKYNSILKQQAKLLKLYSNERESIHADRFKACENCKNCTAYVIARMRIAIT